MGERLTYYNGLQALLYLECDKQKKQGVLTYLGVTVGERLTYYNGLQAET